MKGTAFGRYRLIELLGRGGMGEVWRAHDTDTDRIVAIKVLPAHFSDNEDFKQRFRREAHAAARLNTPHVVPIHNYGKIAGRLYVDMRLIEGRDLQEVLADGPLDPGRAVRIIEQVAKALHAAHKIGLVHRDVKPSNILLDEDDFAYLIDFGIARGANETSLTGTGAMIGSWHYMAPERFRPGDVDARADIYALACVLYECLTGSRPFPGDNLEHQVAAHLSDSPPQPSTTQPELPAAFDAVIATGMAKEPDQRYATTVELANAAHDAITTPLAPPSKPTPLAGAPAGPPPTPARRPPAPPPGRPARSPGPPPRPDAMRQQPADPNLATPQQRAPDGGAGWPPHVQETQRADRPAPYIGAPAPPALGQRPRRRARWPLIGAVVVLLAAGGITGYLLWPHPNPNPSPHQTPTAQPAPASGPPAQPFTG